MDNHYVEDDDYPEIPDGYYDFYPEEYFADLVDKDKVIEELVKLGYRFVTNAPLRDLFFLMPLEHAEQYARDRGFTDLRWGKAYYPNDHEIVEDGSARGLWGRKGE